MRNLRLGADPLRLSEQSLEITIRSELWLKFAHFSFPFGKTDIDYF